MTFRVAAYAPVEEEQDSVEWSEYKTLQCFRSFRVKGDIDKDL